MRKSTANGGAQAHTPTHPHRGYRVAGAVALIAGSALIAAYIALACGSLLMANQAARPDRHPPETTDNEQGGAEMNPIDWNYWLDVNEDIAAWVHIPGTEIDYPVVQANRDEPRFYLDHDVNGNWNLFGCPYLDAGCPAGIDSLNSVIVGHNISFPPAMFHDLEHFVDPDFAREHLNAYIYTPAKVRSMKVAGVKTIAGWEPLKRVEFADEKDFALYYASLLDLCDESYYAKEAPERLVTLCSCSYYFNPDDERTLVFLVDDE